MQAADLEKDCNSFTVCVAIGMFVLGVWGITLPSLFCLFPGTGLLSHPVTSIYVTRSHKNGPLVAGAETSYGLSSEGQSLSPLLDCPTWGRHELQANQSGAITVSST